MISDTDMKVLMPYSGIKKFQPSSPLPISSIILGAIAGSVFAWFIRPLAILRGFGVVCIVLGTTLMLGFVDHANFGAGVVLFAVGTMIWSQPLLAKLKKRN